MLRQTFVHIPGVGPNTEARLWNQGVDDWHKADPAAVRLSPKLVASFGRYLEPSHQAYTRRNAAYFADLLPSVHQWRLYQTFQNNAAYVDIETTGMTPEYDHITTIALYDGKQVRHYVHGRNLDQFQHDIAAYDLIVTYNGKCFDVPFIERSLGFTLPRAHVDLRYVLKSLGYGGGLKGCEKTLGFARPGLEDVDGYMAVLLWREYQRTRSETALDTLLAYNIEDVLTLERLAVFAHNRKIEATPFAQSHRLAEPTTAANPFRPEPQLIRRLRGQLMQTSFARAW